MFLAFFPMILLCLSISVYFYYQYQLPFLQGFLNALPISIISSAIAIPSARGLSAPDRELITYESSLSDIFGVICFNFLSLNSSIDFQAVSDFGLDLLLMFIIAFASTLMLSFLLSRIRHHVKFLPILLLVKLIYSVSKIWHLPSLIFILIFGLFLGNVDELRRLSWLHWLNPEVLHKEVSKFKEITSELTFMIRGLFSFCLDS